ncbi:MAG: DUF167 domain-containing protein [Candidatus Gastranaerophilales bacterium]|nr:DUF167 domain-containing protein [Candidatus Gastranaerophilales bacterium]
MIKDGKEMPKNIDELINLIKNNDTYKFKIKVVANSKINLIDFCEEYIKVKVMARAVDGKANKAIIEYLSEVLSVSKSRISIVNGEKSSIKTIQVKQ